MDRLVSLKAMRRISLRIEPIGPFAVDRGVFLKDQQVHGDQLIMEIEEAEEELFPFRLGMSLGVEEALLGRQPALPIETVEQNNSARRDQRAEIF